MSPPSLELDFRRPPRQRGRAAGWLLLAAATAVAVGLAEHQAGLTQHHALAQDALERATLRLQARAPRAPAAPDAATLAALRRANAVIDQLTVPWDGLFEAVEGADARGLGLLSLSPGARERSLRLTGEARNVGELLAYVDRLAAQPALAQVHLQGYSSGVRDGTSIVSFTVGASWRAQP
jgi:hypothetical protein